MDDYSIHRHASRVWFQSSAATLGAVRCDPEHADFREPGPIQQPVFLFPRASVRVFRPDRRPFVGGPTAVMFYNQGEEVRRESVTGRGDDHEWYALDPQLLARVLRDVQGGVEVDPARPFPFFFGPASGAVVLWQQRLFESLPGQPATDPLSVEEAVVELTACVVRQALRLHRPEIARRRSAPSRGKEWVETAKELLQGRLGEPLTLTQIGREVGCSEFHLARTFRKQTGLSLHHYRQRLRLAAALEAVWDGEADLTALALRLGFSSHSHFTMTFRREFGMTPSAVRDLPKRQRVPRRRGDDPPWPLRDGP